MANHVGHVVPLKVLVTVWAALVALTWLTVAITWFDLGTLNLWAALAIATVKAAEFFGCTDFGVVATGARADLILIARNPLQDLRRVREIGGVVMAGAWTPRRELATRTSGWRQ